MKILVIDNYDSFTYNIVSYLKEISGDSISVYRNDKIGLEEVGNFDKIVLSPGPGVPRDAGVSIDLIKRWAPEKSILGVCLGCQAIAESYGGEIFNLSEVYHGVATYMKVIDQGEKLFEGVPENFTAGRYHSWVINEEKLPSEVKVTARDGKGLIMAVSHRDYDLKGVQFHPESVLTRYGRQMLTNWLGI